MGILGGSPDGLPYDMVNRLVYGEVLSLEAENRTGRLAVAASVVDCELANRTLAYEVAWPEGVVPPAAGETLGLRLTNASASWMLVETYDWTGFTRACAPRHAGDVRFFDPVGIDGSAAESGAATAVRMRYEIVVLGASTTLSFPVSSMQDQPLHVNVSDLALVNNEAFQYRLGRTEPSFAQRVENASIRGCDVAPPSFRLALSPKERAEVELTITCEADARTQPAFYACRDEHLAPGQAGEDPQLVEGGCGVRVPRDRVAAVAGRAAFTDELGVEHQQAEILWHGLLPARAATLTVEAPDVVYEPDDVRVVARYVDERGSPIPNATLHLRMDWPGLENHAFAMRYVAADGSYRWSWDDMREWKPAAWREGAREITVEAQPPVGDDHAPSEATVVMRFAG